jgi:hypothetical protein
MDEVFGQKNFCATFVWNTEGNTDNQYTVKVNHEYVVAYFKNFLNADAAIGRVVDPNTREDSNLWKGTDDGVQSVERQMELAVNHIMPDRTADERVAAPISLTAEFSRERGECSRCPSKTKLVIHAN